eukprot:TRINITY_DN2243_c0_g1_i1.p1 TRINITY_DN2243_c0_g1~~TRINITY_DN2243_c0_g1_i1.p1  ORF type:complete len:412 (-),score=80.52 TRINITY_DN2243_c0_g1_i1:38-1273(-)
MESLSHDDQLRQSGADVMAHHSMLDQIDFFSSHSAEFSTDRRYTEQEIRRVSSSSSDDGSQQAVQYEESDFVNSILRSNSDSNGKKRRSSELSWNAPDSDHHASVRSDFTEDETPREEASEARQDQAADAVSIHHTHADDLSRRVNQAIRAQHAVQQQQAMHSQLISQLYNPQPPPLSPQPNPSSQMLYHMSPPQQQIYLQQQYHRQSQQFQQLQHIQQQQQLQHQQRLHIQMQHRLQQFSMQRQQMHQQMQQQQIAQQLHQHALFHTPLATSLATHSDPRLPEVGVPPAAPLISADLRQQAADLRQHAQHIDDADKDEYIDITPYIGLSQEEASKKIGIPSSTLSKRWREATHNRKWPYRSLYKLDREIKTLMQNISSGDSNSTTHASLALLLRQRQEEAKVVYIKKSKS